MPSKNPRVCLGGDSYDRAAGLAFEKSRYANLAIGDGIQRFFARELGGNSSARGA
jgi:hypothetical protein